MSSEDVKIPSGDKRPLSEKFDVVMVDTDKGYDLYLDNRDTDDYKITFDFAESENVNMVLKENPAIKKLDGEYQCEVVAPAGKGMSFCAMEIKDMSTGSMSVRYKSRVQITRKASGEGSATASGSGAARARTPSPPPPDPEDDDDAPPPPPEEDEEPPKKAPAPAKPAAPAASGGSKSSSSSVSGEIKGTAKEEEKKAAAKGTPEEERKLSDTVSLFIKKNFEGFIVYASNTGPDPCFIDCNFAKCENLTAKESPNVKKKDATTFNIRVEPNFKVPFAKLVLKEKEKPSKVDYVAELSMDLSGNEMQAARNKLLAKAAARAEAEAKTSQGSDDAAAAAASSSGGGGGSTAEDRAAQAKQLASALKSMDTDKKITDTLTFSVKASVDGFVTYLGSEDQDPFVVTVDFAGSKNLKFNPCLGTTSVGGEKYQMTIEPKRKLPFVKLPIAEKGSSIEWALNYNFTYKNDNSLRQAQERMQKARERTDA